MNQRAKSFAKIVANFPNDKMAFEDPYNPLLLQFLLYLSTNIIKDTYHHFGGNIPDLPDLNKRKVAAAIVQN